MPTIIPNIMLCYLAHPGEANPLAIEMADRYWATGPNGKFLYAAADLRRHYGFRTQSTMIDTLATVATAHHRCRDCGATTQLQMRSEVHSGGACANCSPANRVMEQNLEKERLENSLREAELHSAIATYMETLDQKTTNYLEAPYDTCLRLRALHQLYGNEILTGASFSALQPPQNDTHGTGALLFEVFEAGIIDPVAGNPNYAQGLFLYEDRLCFNDRIVNYRLRPHSSGSREEALSIALARTPADPEAAVSLWYDLATQECLTYLERQLKHYHLPELEGDSLSQIRTTLREALAQHSIAELWNASWIAAKAAESSSYGKCAVPQNVVKTIPAQLVKLLNQIQSGYRTLKQWHRHSACPPSALFRVYQQQFKLDELTDGRTAERVITQATTKADPDSLLMEYGQRLRDLMHEAAHEGLTAEVMLHFGQCQGMGLSMAETLASIDAAFPAINLANARESDPDDE